MDREPLGEIPLLIEATQETISRMEVHISTRAAVTAQGLRIPCLCGHGLNHHSPRCSRCSCSRFCP